VRLLQCAIRLSRKLSGEEPEVQRLSRQPWPRKPQLKHRFKVVATRDRSKRIDFESFVD
jgi:hypothetical protein